MNSETSNNLSLHSKVASGCKEIGILKKISLRQRLYSFMSKCECYYSVEFVYTLFMQRI